MKKMSEIKKNEEKKYNFFIFHLWENFYYKKINFNYN